MNEKKPKSKLIIFSSKKGKIVTELKEGNWGESVHQIINVGTFSFEESENVHYADIEKGDELVLEVIDDKKNKRKFFYWIESVSMHFDREKESPNEVIIQANSFPSILTKNTIEGIQKFSKGYGEIVKKFAKQHRMNTTRVKLINKKGMIFFKRMTLLEAFRRMASIEGWCFYFRDKNIIFEPCTPPKDSGVVLTDKEILSGTYTK